MYQSIKLNKDYWTKFFPALKYGTPDPLQVFSDDQEKFSKAMKTFQINGVNKNTKAGRHRETQIYLKSWVKELDKPPVILDIGASDGVTSFELMGIIDDYFDKYYVTDYNIKCNYSFYKGYAFFFNGSHNCFLVASKRFVFYPMNKWFFDLLFRRKIDAIKQDPGKELLLINKNLKKKCDTDDRVDVVPYNVFEPWRNAKANIVIVGNLLHEVYFTKAEIEKGIRNCYDAVLENGLLVIIRNTVNRSGAEIEKSTIYRKNSMTKKLDKVYEINGGVEISDFLLSLDFSKPTDNESSRL